MKKHLVLLLALVLLLLTSVAVADVAINKKNFPDSVFRKIVEQADTNKDGKLSDEEVAVIKNINVSKYAISDLTGIEYFKELVNLDCSRNNLKKIDVSKNTKLEKLNVTDNKLKKLDVRKLKNLVSLDCGINQLTKLDLSKNTKLEQLFCYENKLTKLNVQKNKKLKYLQCDNNPGLKTLDVSKCKILCEAVRNNPRKYTSTSSGVNYDYFGYNAEDKLNVVTIDAATKVIAGDFVSDPAAGK